MRQVSSFNIASNVVIKKPVPALGLVMSNPERKNRLEKQLDKPSLHTQSWGIDVVTGYYQDKPVFLASVPMGAGGSGFAFHELFVAGAASIVRMGSNDHQVTRQDLNRAFLIKSADHLLGLSSEQNQQGLAHQWIASDELIKKLKASMLDHQIDMAFANAHHLEDYHAFNYPNLLPESCQQYVLNQIEIWSQSREPSVWDMETAALYYRAHLLHKNACSVVQNVPKHGETSDPYQTELREEILLQELRLAKSILEGLIS